MNTRIHRLLDKPLLLLGTAVLGAGLLTACGTKPDERPAAAAPEPVETTPPADVAPPPPAPTDPTMPTDPNAPPSDPNLPPPANPNAPETTPPPTDDSTTQPASGG